MTRFNSPFGPLIKWPNLHYPGIEDSVIKWYKVTFPGGRTETVRNEGLRNILRDLGPGEHVDIERIEREYVPT